MENVPFHTRKLGIKLRYFTYHHLFLRSFYGLIGIVKLTIRVNLHIQSEHRKIRTRKNLVFGHFSRSARLSHGIALNQNITFKSNWSIAWTNKQMLYLNYGKIVFWIVEEIQWIVVFFIIIQLKKHPTLLEQVRE